MENALTLTDFGQGKTPIVLPVSRCTPQKMSVPRYITGQQKGTAQYSAAQQHSIASQHNLAADSQPYSAFEILQKCFLRVLPEKGLLLFGNTLLVFLCLRNLWPCLPPNS